MIDPETDCILITGAAGEIGTALREGLRSNWRKLRLTDLHPVCNLAKNEEFINVNIGDKTTTREMMKGVKALVHLAANHRTSSDSEAVFEVNSRGLFNVFEAARNAGVERIIFASSNHTFGYYPIEEIVSPDHKVRPDSIYGVLKVFGENMLQYYYDRYGIRSVSLRIGTFCDKPEDQRSLATWLSPRDVCQLVDKSLRHPDPGCVIVNGYSANRQIKVSEMNWKFLGYSPVDDAEEHVDALRLRGIDVTGSGPWTLHGGKATVPDSG